MAATTWSFLDFTSYGTTSATTVAEAYGLSGAPINATTSVNVAFVLPRAHDPSAHDRASIVYSAFAKANETVAGQSVGHLWRRRS